MIGSSFLQGLGLAVVERLIDAIVFSGWFDINLEKALDSQQNTNRQQKTILIIKTDRNLQKGVCMKLRH